MAILLTAAMLAGLGPVWSYGNAGSVAEAASGVNVSVPEDRIYITSSRYAIVSGAEETVLTTNNTEGTDQRIGYILNVSPEAYQQGGNLKVVACYKDYQYEEFGLQTVTDQAAAYEAAHPGEKVVAGINADFYNMTTGEPSGAFVMNGTVYHKVNNRPYFAILKDGTAVIRDGSHTDLSDVQEAVAGNEMIVTDGKVSCADTDYGSLSYSRTAIGIKADGTIMTYVTHGISRPTSCGETYEDIAKIMIAQGCVTALMLDGGGYATYASMREGTDKLVVQNSPSDGTPRTVSDTLLFVSTVNSDGTFDHASLSPNNEYYTPSTENAVTQVPFRAVGVDASGASCDLPESGLVWKLTEESSNLGEINAETGLFTAKARATGMVETELWYENEIVGTTTIQLKEPDELYFSNVALSLDFSASSDLGLMVKGEGVDLNIKEGDFVWTVASKDADVADEWIGTIVNNRFVSGAKQNFALNGLVTVSYTKMDGTVLEASVSVEIGKMPVVKLDFEDVEENGRGKDVVGLWDWGASASYFTDAAEAQKYEFETYEMLYYLQSTTYSADAYWIN